jgi:CBS-domain-containing membrane protein
MPPSPWWPSAALPLLGLASPQPLMVAPLGASAVLLFAQPRSPFFQPRNRVLGRRLHPPAGC